jgi:glycosyltransferase involved in cell wall biosynthesis
MSWGGKNQKLLEQAKMNDNQASDNNPLVSIIIPSFNREKLIGETLDSVLAQTYPKWECIIVDDGSTDDTIVVIQEYCKKDKRFRFHKRHRQPKGAPTCRNIGLAKAEGKYIIFLDSDDLLDLHCLQQRIEIMEKNPLFAFTVFPMLRFYKIPGDSNILLNKSNKESNINRFIKRDSVWGTPGPIWRQEAIRKIGGFEETMKCWQDGELHLKALFEGLDYKVYDEAKPDTFYRKHNNNSISQHHLNDDDKMQSRIKLYTWTYKKTIEKGLYYKLDTQTALRQLFLDIAFSLGNTVRPLQLLKLLKDNQNRKLISYSDIYFLTQNAIVYYSRLYKIKSIRSLNQKMVNKRLMERSIGKYRLEEKNHINS